MAADDGEPETTLIKPRWKLESHKLLSDPGVQRLTPVVGNATSPVFTAICFSVVEIAITVSAIDEQFGSWGMPTPEKSGHKLS